jgi:transcriptional regulator with XRE-family HTH domain
MNRLRELREANRYSQNDIAEIIGCTSVTISRYELGQRKIPSTAVEQLSNLFNCSSDYLLGISDINAKSPAETSGAGNIPDEFMRLQEANKLYLLLDDAGRAQARAYLEFLVAQQEKQADSQG